MHTHFYQYITFFYSYVSDYEDSSGKLARKIENRHDGVASSGIASYRMIYRLVKHLGVLGQYYAFQEEENPVGNNNNNPVKSE